MLQAQMCGYVLYVIPMHTKGIKDNTICLYLYFCHKLRATQLGPWVQGPRVLAWVSSPQVQGPVFIVFP